MYGFRPWRVLYKNHSAFFLQNNLFNEHNLKTTMDIKRTIISAVLVWTLGVTAYIMSFFVEIMNNPELQANVILTLAVIPSSILGAKLYYKKGANTNGFKLGILFFLMAMFLDAVITVPLFIIPAGGNHLSFFSDPVFWLIGLEFILVVGFYFLISSKTGLHTKSQGE